MATFAMLTRIKPGGLSSGHSLRHLERQTMEHIRSECPSVEWLHSWAILGPCDYLDVFRAPDVETAVKVSTLVHLHGQATTETWGAVEWEQFKEMLEGMPAEILGANDPS